MQSEMDSEIFQAVVNSPCPIEICDLLVAYLEQLEIEYVFGIPGGAIEPLFNALARSKRRNGTRPVVSRHETGAAFMASGYAINSRKLGVCCSTTGPGATNLITGVASAYENDTPLLVVTAQTSLKNFGKGAFQESSCTGTNILGMFEFCTHYNTLISSVEQFENKLCSAILTAMQNQGPVHISIPLDIHKAKANVQSPSYDLKKLLDKPALVDKTATKKLLKEFTENKNIVLVIGEGCSEAISTVLSIAYLLDAKVVTTPHGKGLISPYHPLMRGVIGFAGHKTAIETLMDPEVDIIVAVGTVLSEWASNGWDERTLLNEKLIHVESNEKHFLYSPMAKLHIRGDISHIFGDILNSVFSLARTRDIHNMHKKQYSSIEPIKDENGKLYRQFELDNENKYIDNAVPIKPQWLMGMLTEQFPCNCIYLVDTGNSMSWGIHYLHPYDRRIRGKRDASAGLFQSCLEFASMGWAIAASIGTSLAKPGTPVVCITGDGSMLMAGQEITVAIQEELPVIFVILNDAAYGMVKHGQQLAGAESIGYELPIIDYSSMAKAMGAHAHAINTPKDFLNLNIEKICKRKGPTLLDVRIDTDEIPPMGMRIKVLNEVDNSKNKN